MRFLSAPPSAVRQTRSRPLTPQHPHTKTHQPNQQTNKRKPTKDRKRWVVYKDPTPPYKPNPTSIPPEWHGWINYINDYEPGTHKFAKAIYALPACPPSSTGSAVGGYYQPKGSWANPRQLKWKKYSAWRPPGASSEAAGK